MKKIFQNIFGIVALLAVTALSACSPEDFNDVSEAGLPTLNADNIEITVDQETNQVTFTYNAIGVMPVWIFSDGSSPSTSTTNGLSKIYTTAGTYSVEVKVMNANGIADGSVVKEFTINNTIIDYSGYLTRLCGSDGTKTWMIDSGTAGHLACGESGTDGTNWWSASANEKAAYGVYENRFIYATVDGTSDGGAYTFDPAESGTIYVNIGCSVLTSPDGATEDYTLPADIQETTFSFEVDGNDLYLVFPAGTYLGYVASDNMYNNPRMQVLSLTSSKLELVYDDGSIAWHYLYCPEVETLSTEEMLYGSGSKTWYWDSNNAGHFGCGESGTVGTGWWSASANEKADMGLYDQSFTFTSDGVYTLTTGDQGIFVNIGCTVYTAPDGATADYTVAVDGNQIISTYTLSESGTDYYIVLPAGIPLGYVPNDNIYNSPQFKIWSISETTLELVADDGTIAWYYRFVTDPESTGDDDVEEFDEGEELLVSEYAKGLLGSWTWEASTAYHFACGESVTNATNWWGAAANEKDGMGLYDDVLTFNSDGSYVFNPGDGGTVYVNIGVTVSPFIDAKGDATEDYQVTVSEQTSTYTLTSSDGSYYITWPANTLVSYVPADDFYAAPQVLITRMCENLLEFNTVQSGISWHYRLKRVE